ncbi:MAG: BREX-1 system phosphatase PglZ type A, partial [Lutispora sp.]|nr:BREX-1 system phosphatase PglZ type A [Lutispora sp.]
DNGQIYIEGMSSGTMEGRQGILSLHEKSSVAIDYKDFMKMGKNELREYCKPKKLIYIYHDSIDALGDKAASEIYAFDGAEKAFDEIFKLIKNIRGNLSGTNIFITADHGFIYQRDELEEVDKIGKEKIDFVESKRRYVITKENRDIDGLLRYSMKDTLGDDCNLNVYIPKANIRFKTQGAGANFVHGGASLQEVVIPLITYKNRWSGQSDAKAPEKTKIKLTNAIRKITNSIFTLNFFQTERVEGKITPCSVRVYMVDGNDNLISNEEVLLGDKTSQNPEDRNISIRFVLKSMDYDKNRNYYLIIKDDDTDVVYDRIPFSISLGIASDFDF